VAGLLDEVDQCDAGAEPPLDSDRTGHAIGAGHDEAEHAASPTCPTLASVMTRGKVALGWIVALGVALLSVALRVWHRGDYIPGWDVLGAAQGLWLVTNRTPREIVDWYVRWHGDMSVFWNMYVLPSVLIPGALAGVVPWLYWNHVLAATLTAGVLLLLASAFRLGWRWSWIVVLAWATSSTLVSQSVTGLACVSALLPHAVAIWIVLRLRKRPVSSLLAGVAIWFLSWHGQELGRTACLTLLTAAIVTRVRWPTRIAWLTAGVALLLDGLWHPSANTASFTAVGMPTLQHLGEAVAGVSLRLVAPPWIDLPTLVVTALVAAVLLRTDAFLWRIVLAVHLGLTVVLALQRGVDNVWPRRFVVVDFYCLATVVAYVNDAIGRARARSLRIAVAVLIVGALWQLEDTVRFVQTGFEVTPGEGVFSLPFTHTSSDYQTVPQDVVWSRDMLADARAGHRIVLAYNFSSYEENATNPSAVPERLYLALGPATFDRDVAFFGETKSRTDLRARTPDGIERFVDGIESPDDWVGWFALHPSDEWDNPESRRRRLEVDRLLSALERRFRLQWEAPLPGGPSHIQRFTLAVRDSNG
jgi:hypothetical protein